MNHKHAMLDGLRSNRGTSYGRAAATLGMCLVALNALANDYVAVALPSPGVISIANAINNAGQVAGSYSSGGVSHAALWSGATVSELVSEGRGAYAYAINSTGQVVGVAGNSTGIGGAVLWSGNSSASLPVLGGRSGNSAFGINDAGRVVGSSGYDNTNTQIATYWIGGSVFALGTAGSSGDTYANAINNNNQIVGQALNVNGQTHAILWSGNGSIDLNAQSNGQLSQAWSINNNGQVVGLSQQSGRTSAVRWSGGTATFLSTLGGTNGSAYDINDGGLIVGWSDTSGNRSRHATLWTGTSVIDLNQALSDADVAAGWQLESSSYIQDKISINDSGLIAVTAYNRLTNGYRAYLLTPASLVPEPGLLSLSSMGLMAILLMVERRRKRGPDCEI